MLENARRGSCQQVRALAQLEIKEERFAERSEDGGRRRGEEIETGSRLTTSLVRPKGVVHANVLGELKEYRPPP